MAVTTITKEGAFDHDVRTQINDNFAQVGSGGSFVSPAITGTVTGGASYTAPTLTAVTITGTSTIANGMTITTPVLSGTVTGTYTLGGTPTLASAAGVPYVAGVAAGYKFARSAAPTAVTGTLDIDSGLATVVSVVVTASSDMDGTSLAAVSGVITGAAGHFTAKCWKVTTGGAAGNPTLIAADAAKNVNWIAIGT